MGTSVLAHPVGGQMWGLTGGPWRLMVALSLVVVQLGSYCLLH